MWAANDRVAATALELLTPLGSLKSITKRANLIVQWEMLKEIRIPDALYAKIESAAGSRSVDQVVAEAVAEYLVDKQFDADAFFTTERLAELDQASMDVKAGNALPLDEALGELERMQKAWQRKAG